MRHKSSANCITPHPALSPQGERVWVRGGTGGAISACGTKKVSITFVVPAYNEEPSLAATIRNIVEACAGLYLDYAVIIVNDASTDNTLVVAQCLAAENPCIQVLDNPKNLGFSGSFRRGVQAVRTEYLMMVPGDNDFAASEIRKLLQQIGQADIIEHYPSNPEIRSWDRRMISTAFVWAMNFCFRLRLPYYNGITIYKKVLLDTLPFQARDFTYNAQILVRAVKRGYTFRGVGVKLSERKFGQSSVYKLKNVLSCLRSIAALWVQIMVLRKG
jgi:glycosyltransferase involved in cell wall biosynthesis